MDCASADPPAPTAMPKKPAAQATRQLNIGLIGQKFMGRAHSNAWAQVGKFFAPDLQPVLHTVAGRDGPSLCDFAKRFGWQQSTTRWQDLVDDESIDLVDVGTPNHTHREQAVALLEAGKHVACEKPLAGTLEDARAMRDAAKRVKRKGQQTFVWFNYRRCPAVAFAHQLIREGKLGEIYHVRAHYLQDWGGPETPMSWRFQKRLAGSGAHGDLNAHIVDLARFLTGDEITSVNGAIAKTFIKARPKLDAPVSKGKQQPMGKSDVDDCVLFLASFKGGATASFEASRLAFGHQNDNNIEINGSKGSLRFGFEDMNLLHFADATDPSGIQGWRRIMCTSAGNHPYVANWWPDAHVLGYEHGFTNMAADILLALQKQAPPIPLPDFEDAYQTQRVLEAALLAAKEGRQVPMSEVK